MATTTIYASAVASVPVQSTPVYSSVYSAVIPTSSLSVLSSMGYSSPSDVLPTPESTVSLQSIPVYSASSEYSMLVSSSVEGPIPTYASPAPQVTYSSIAPVAYSSVATVSIYTSQSELTVPSYETPIETTVMASTYSAPSKAVPTSVVVVSVPASSSVPSTTSMPSSVLVSVPAYNGTSKTSTYSWKTIATSSASASMSLATSSMVTAPAYSEASTTTAATSTSASICQTALTGAYQTPHLIVPISSGSPDTAYGTQYDAYIDSENSTIFNFDIPSSYEGMTCTTIFLFPEIADLETSSYTFSGSGDLVFSELSTAATEETTYNTAPSVESVLDTIAIESGNSYVVASGSCAAGTTVSIELSSQSGLSLEFFEDWK